MKRLGLHLTVTQANGNDYCEEAANIPSTEYSDNTKYRIAKGPMYRWRLGSFFEKRRNNFCRDGEQK